MTATRSWLILSLIVLLLLGGCSALSGDFQHYPASIPAVIAMFTGKALNDRWPLVKWPMEFFLWSAVVLIFFNLVYLHFKPF